MKEIEVVDLKSAINNVDQQFSNLLFHEQHEKVYGMDTILSMEACRNLSLKFQ